MNTRMFFPAAALFAVAAVWSATPVFAQIGGGSGGSGSGSGGSGSGSGGSGSGSGSGSSGSGSGLGSGSGSSGSRSGSSGSGAGSSGTGTGSGAGFDDSSSSSKGFVGADSSDNLSVRGGTASNAAGGGAGGNQGPGGFFNQLFGQGGLGGSQQQQQRNQPATGRVRVRLTPTIEFFNSSEPNAHAVRIADRHALILPHYRNNPHLGSIAGVQMVVNDRVAVLTGTVATERQKDLIGGMLELEPGISSVDNRIIVAPAILPAATSPGSSSTPAFSAAPN